MPDLGNEIDDTPAPPSPREVTSFVADIVKELAGMAYDRRADFLVYLLRMAACEAARLTDSTDRSVAGPRQENGDADTDLSGRVPRRPRAVTNG